MKIKYIQNTLFKLKQAKSLVIRNVFAKAFFPRRNLFSTFIIEKISTPRNDDTLDRKTLSNHIANRCKSIKHPNYQADVVLKAINEYLSDFFAAIKEVKSNFYLSNGEYYRRQTQRLNRSLDIMLSESMLAIEIINILDSRNIYANKKMILIDNHRLFSL